MVVQNVRSLLLRPVGRGWGLYPMWEIHHPSYNGLSFGILGALESLSGCLAEEMRCRELLRIRKACVSVLYLITNLQELCKIIQLVQSEH